MWFHNSVKNLKTRGRSSSEVTVRRRNAPPFPAQLQMTVVEDRQKESQPCYRVAMSDITESKLVTELEKTSEQLKELTHHIQLLHSFMVGTDAAGLACPPQFVLNFEARGWVIFA